jgi:dihydroxyacetone kinase-like protein
MRIRGGGGDGAAAPATPEVTVLERVDAFVRIALASIERHEALLDRLDVALGDGDHGTNMAIGLRSVARTLDETPATERPADVGERLRQIGHIMVSSVGGASGPLYGTAFIEAGFFLAGASEVDPDTMAEAFEIATRALARRGRCAVGDKTILDALDPATRAVRAAVDRGESVERALAVGAEAAAEGMRSTIPLVARRGLALRLGERSRGHRDPGATSCFLLVRAMASVGRSDDLGT